jgi:hypothetical protein
MWGLEQCFQSPAGDGMMKSIGTYSRMLARSPLFLPIKEAHWNDLKDGLVDEIFLAQSETLHPALQKNMEHFAKFEGTGTDFAHKGMEIDEFEHDS